MKISRVNSSNADYAIREHFNNGFNFGNTLHLNSNINIYFDNSGYYDVNVGNVLSPYLDNSFVPEEIEVFKITAS